jgi:hypothetical protein
VTTKAQLDTIDALVELVRDGQLTWSAAVLMYRCEYGVTYLECVDLGLVALTQQADIDWRKKTQPLNLRGVTLAPAKQNRPITMKGASE